MGLRFERHDDRSKCRVWALASVDEADQFARRLYETVRCGRVLLAQEGPSSWDGGCWLMEDDERVCAERGTGSFLSGLGTNHQGPPPLSRPTPAAASSQRPAQFPQSTDSDSESGCTAQRPPHSLHSPICAAATATRLLPANQCAPSVLHHRAHKLSAACWGLKARCTARMTGCSRAQPQHAYEQLYCHVVSTLTIARSLPIALLCHVQFRQLFACGPAVCAPGGGLSRLTAAGERASERARNETKPSTSPIRHRWFLFLSQR